MAFVSYASAKSQIIDKRMKILAIAADERWEGMPNVPTLAEAGYPNVAIDSVFGLAGPLGMEQSVVEKIRTAFESCACRKFKPEGSDGVAHRGQASKR